MPTMRFLLFLGFAIGLGACGNGAPPIDSRSPVSVYVRTGEFLRAEYVDSVWMASIDPRMEARTRAMELWRQHGTPGMDSVVVWVSNRLETAYGADKIMLFFRFTGAELGGPPGSDEIVLLPDPARPVEVQIVQGSIRAAFIDSALVAKEDEPRRERMHALARQVWGQHGASADSVIIEVSNRAPPTPETARLPHRDPHTTFIGHFLREELEGS